ncbi:MAG: FAD-dependent oxidoreductase [Bacteroidota bacterium]
MSQRSFWEQQTFLAKADIAIIGGGIVGLSAALALKTKDAQLRIVLVERGPIPTGASTRNAGFACIGSMTELLDDLNHQPSQQVWALVAKRWEGLCRLRSLVGEEHMDYMPSGNEELFRSSDLMVYEQCLDHLEAFNKELKAITGQSNCFQINDQRLKDWSWVDVQHLISNRAEGQLHPGKMMQCLLTKAQEAGVQILNGLAIVDIEDAGDSLCLRAQENWAIKCKKCLVATNGFASRLLPELEVQAARNQVLITKEIPGLKVKGCFHYDKGYLYFRNVGNRLLLGGGRNLDRMGEQTDEFGTSQLIQGYLLDFLQKVILPEHKVEVEQWWSGILGVGSDKSPIVKMLGPRLGVAVRLGGMGVAIGTLVGEEAAVLLLEDTKC